MKVLSIINPVSGTKKAVSTYRKLTLEKKGIHSTPFITEYAGHARETIETLSLKDYDAIIVFGGDGTIHEVVNGLMRRKDGVKIPIGVIPLGTGNALMHDLGILNVDKAVDRILQKNKFTIDILECSCPGEIIYSFNMLGWGIPVTINKIAEKYRYLGKQRYNVASLLELMKNPSWKCKITLDNTVVDDEIIFFMTCNNQYTGNGMKIAPDASMDDGKMDVVIMKAQSRFKLFTLFLQVFSGKHIYHPDILYQKAERIRIEPSSQMILNIDGQQTGRTPVKIKVLPKQVDIFI